jgi:aspartyl-tRNA(Asn)/glutamyl-tRNA(Gln) amidotransferase subunit C
MLTKKELEHLASLARIELREEEEEKLQKDLGSILDYFNELKVVNTDHVAPMTGGTSLKNVLREDVVGMTDDTGRGIDNFPDAKDGYLKVPPIF